MFGSCKIFSGNAIFGKEKYFQVLGCIPKNTLENTHFYHVSHIFLRSKQILLHRIKIYKQHKKQKSKQKQHLFTNSVKGGRKSERLREREIGKERIGVDGGGGS